MEGEYTLFAVQNDGYTADSDDMDTYSTMTLSEDGTGSMIMNDDALEITEWTEVNGTLTIAFPDGSSIQGTIRNGLAAMDIWGTGDMIAYYAKEGADTSGIRIMTVDEILAAYEASVPDSMLYALWESLDTEAGVHMSYDMHTDYLDADQSFDVHGKDGVYYSLRTTNVSGYKNATITFFRDGTAYNLDPEDMTGLIATTTTSSVITKNVMLMDNLYSDMWHYAQEMDYTVETRDMDGASYTTEVFSDGAAFYFDDAGQLVYYITDIDGIGETVYMIHAIDGTVDEALFDISGYEISE